MNKILILIIIIIILYSICYFIFPEEISILQMKKNNINIDTLLSKQPIVIEDNIDTNYIQKIFKYNIINLYNIKELWTRSQFKYTLIYAKIDISIFISNPKCFSTKIPDENDTVIEIKLKKYNSLILPYKWYYSLNEENKDTVIIQGIHDYITYILSIIF